MFFGVIKVIFFLLVVWAGSLTAFQNHNKHHHKDYSGSHQRHSCYPKNYPGSGYLTSTITWSYADGYYVVHPNDNLFYYPFPSHQWHSWEREISWITYDDPSWERGYWIDRKCHQMKENGLALIATCIQDLRSLCHRKWISQEGGKRNWRSKDWERSWDRD